jgi:chemosensory pili system protein ChpA (sensor histidine kinase/response regulator)
MSALRDAIDTTTLGWIKPELDETLRQARHEIEAFAEDPTDASRMRFCASFLHQVHGTLRMVELYAPAMVAEEMERLAQALAGSGVPDHDEACSALMRGVVLLPDYLERLQGGHRDIPIVLLPLLNELRAARGESGLSEGVLFAPDLDRPLPDSVPAPAPQPRQARQAEVAPRLDAFKAAVEDWPEQGAPADAGALARAVEALLAVADHEAARRMLWVASSVADALRDGALPPTAALRQAFASVEREARRMFDDNGFSAPRAEPTLEPTRQLLYHVAHSDGRHEALDGLRDTFALNQQLPTESELAHARGSVSGRNRALLDTVSAAIKEDLLRVKDALDLHLRTGQAGVADLQPQVEALGRVADTLGMMGLGVARNVVLQQRDAMHEIVYGNRDADEGALLDVAGALLYVDASLDDQVARLGLPDAEAEEDVTAGEARKVLDTLVREAIANFSDARQAFVAFVETNWDHGELAEVPRLLDEVGGALRMLELPQPAQYLTGVRRYTEVELVGRRRVPNGQQLDTLADALASLEYYLEALRDQRPNRDEILDIARQSLEALRYWPLPEEEAPAAAAEQEAPEAAEAAEAAGAATTPEAVAGSADAAAPAESAAVAAGDDDAVDRAEAGVAALPEDRAAPVPPPAPAPMPTGLAGGFEASEDIDDEIREVFLEEFEEEIGNLETLLPAWKAAPDDLERLRPIRRVFHTLKGSGRLVGARVLGEFSWKVENMLNRVLDGTRAPSPAAIALVDQAFLTLPQLHAALRGEAAIAADLAGIEALADRIAAGEEAFYVAPATAPEPEAEPEAADASAEAEAAADADAGAETVDARVDPVLLEILAAEAAGHVATIQAWIDEARAAPRRADDALLRAVHTMNGAFAMTEVPSITDVTTPTEAWVKRLLASGAPADADGVAALAEVAAAIRATLDALQSSTPRVRVYRALAARMAALRDSLPEARHPLFPGTGEAVDGDQAPELAEEELAALDLSAFTDLADAAPEGTGLGAVETAVDATDERDAARASEDEALAGEALPGAEAAGEASIAGDAVEAGSGAGIELDGWEQSDAAAELARLEAELLEAERVEAERAEAERIEAERIEAERAEADRVEAERVEAERIEAERIEAERIEAERIEAERIEAERVEAERAEAERAEAERIEAERAEAERAEAERIEAERIEAERIEAERIEAERAEAERIEAERAEAERAEAERAEAAPAPGPACPQPVAAAAAIRDPDEPLDLSDLDPELVEIFVEEGVDLLDHSDGLLAQLRENPTERENVVGLQRDLHTLKGGARMAGIMAVGELGHAMESLLEAVADGKRELGADGIDALERGFDRLHAMVTRVGEHRAIAMPDALIAEFDARARGEALPAAGAVPALRKPAAALKPLSAPIDEAGEDDEDIGVRAPQEQVRIRADLLDRLVNYAGEVAIYRARLEQQLGAFRGAMAEMEQTNTRLRDQLRRLDIETEAQIIARFQREQEAGDVTFDPLELDRFSTLQQLSRALAESAADLTSLQVSMDDLTRQYETLLLQQSRVSSDLQEGLMRTRMVPFEALVPRLRRVLRQAAAETGKQVQLRLDGAAGELDRNVLERMTAPLEHMLRNSVAHGLELPEARRRAGKPEEGEVRLALRREGSEVVIEVSDDGAGLDREAIRRRAIERGLIRKDAVLADGDLDTLILEQGFSTADTVSRLAGRGVGMDVVASEVRQLGGTLDIASRPGKGVRFTLRLPQTLAVTQAAFVRIGDTTFAVPIASVRGVGRISREELARADASYTYGGESYALHDLGLLVGQTPARAEGQLQMPLLLVRSGDLRAAVSVDQVLGNREIVVKPVGPQVASLPGIFGATIMGDGSVVVILDVAPLVRRQATLPRDLAPAPKVEQRRVPLVMVVDDSVTMRKVTGRVLERHNFEVMTAKDGVDALERLGERVPDLMLLDIEMPRMDGYELATEMKADGRLRDIPIMMITSRTGEKHRQRAFDIGVNRYLGKPYQEHELLRNVFELLAEHAPDLGAALEREGG